MSALQIRLVSDMKIFTLLVVTLLACPQALAADTFVLGHALSNTFMDYAKIDCPAGHICLDGWSKWVIEVDTTLSGPALTGRIIAARMQHTTVHPSYRKRLRLFVIRPIENPKQRAFLRANYLLVDTSERHQMYCLWEDPKKAGLAVDKLFGGAVDGSTRYCFELPDTEQR